jgi:hypothetical protein
MRLSIFSSSLLLLFLFLRSFVRARARDDVCGGLYLVGLDCSSIRYTTYIHFLRPKESNGERREREKKKKKDPPAPRRKHSKLVLRYVFATNTGERRRGERTNNFLFSSSHRDTPHDERVVNDNDDEKKKRCNMNRNNRINETSGIGNERF